MWAMFTLKTQILLVFKHSKLIKQVGLICRLIKSVLKSDQPGTFAPANDATLVLSIIGNAKKITGAKRFIKITDRFIHAPPQILSIFCVSLPLRRSTTVSLESIPFICLSYIVKTLLNQ